MLNRLPAMVHADLVGKSDAIDIDAHRPYAVLRWRETG
ncbi:hypothetical protein Pd630_LPD04533 [Rhodococcus opacus PD630]|nr:hypothetical protein Pd630_LPD04533 [Rhodococcus opacus PD630]